MEFHISFILVILTMNFSGCYGENSKDNEVSELKVRFLEIEGRMASQERHINKLKTKLRSQNEELQDMKIELSKLQPKIKTMESGMNSLRNIIKRTKLVQNDRKNLHMEKQASSIDDVKRQKLPDEHRETRILSQNSMIQQQAVAFYAYMRGNEENPGKHHILVFDDVKTKTGKEYNAFNGMFMAPSGGFYVFTTSIRMAHQYAVYEIVKNADVAGAIFVDSEGSNEQRYASVTLILELVQGDVVFVRTSATYTPHGSVISDGNGRSSFAGWRLQ